MTIKSMIRKWVKNNFGESEVNDPSWNIDLLADYIENELKKNIREHKMKNNTPKYFVFAYWKHKNDWEYMDYCYSEKYMIACVKKALAKGYTVKVETNTETKGD